MLTIAITGSNGEVGKRTVLEALKDGHSVIGLDQGDEPLLAPGMDDELRKRFTYKQADLKNRDAFLGAARGSDAMIHLAAVFKKEGVPASSQLAEHVIHNWNTVMSWNALDVAAELGHKRVSLASSINAIGLKFSKRPTLHYFPLDEEHPCDPEDAYSVSKLELEVQANAFARKYGMRVACIRPHWVIPESLAYDPEKLDATGGLANDLWAWTSEGQAARAFLLGLTAPASTFPDGTAEAFFVVAPTTVRRCPTKDLIKEHYPEVTDWRFCDFDGNEGLYDCSKAENMLGWTERGFSWYPDE